MTVNERLLDAAIHRAIDLHQFSEGAVRRMMEILNKADADLLANLARALNSLPANSFTVDRLERLLESVRFVNARAYASIASNLSDELRALVQIEGVFQFGLFTTLVPAEVLGRIPLIGITVEQVYAAAMARPFQGRLLSEWARSISADRMTRIRDAIRIGYVSNETTSQIMTRVGGTRAFKYRDGIIDIDRRHLRSVVNTAVSHTAGSARDKFYEVNADLIAAVQWVSTLDARTTEACQIRDKKRYKAVTHEPIGHSVKWMAGPGKLHWNCRSTSSPITKSWKELTGSDLERFSSSTRASMDGQVPAVLSYGDWLQRQSAARQNEILGVTRGRLMRAGKLPWASMFTSNGQYLTLEQLRARGVV